MNLTDNKLKNAVDQLIDVGMRFTTMTSEIRSFPDCSCNIRRAYKTSPSSRNTPLIVKNFSFSKSAHLDLSNNVKSKKRQRGTFIYAQEESWKALPYDSWIYLHRPRENRIKRDADTQLPHHTTYDAENKKTWE